MLTERQATCLEFIKSEFQSKGVSPSFEEIRLHMGLSSKAAVHRLVTTLEARGMIFRLKHRARGICPTELAPKRATGAITLAMNIKSVAERREGGKVTHARAIKEIISLCNGALMGAEGHGT